MIYRVAYHSMTASYGPKFVEADSKWEAVRKAFDSSFSDSELAVCASAMPSSIEEVRRTP